MNIDNFGNKLTYIFMNLKSVFPVFFAGTFWIKISDPRHRINFGGLAAKMSFNKLQTKMVKYLNNQMVEDSLEEM